MELEESEMWLALCELDIECHVSSYNPKYIAQALPSLISQQKLTRTTKERMRKLLGRMGLGARVCCVFTMRPRDCLYFTLCATWLSGPMHVVIGPRLLCHLEIGVSHEPGCMG